MAKKSAVEKNNKRKRIDAARGAFQRLPRGDSRSLQPALSHDFVSARHATHRLDHLAASQGQSPRHWRERWPSR